MSVPHPQPLPSWPGVDQLDALFVQHVCTQALVLSATLPCVRGGGGEGDNAFFSTPVDKARQYLFTFTWEGQQYAWRVMPQRVTASPSDFSQTLKADLDGIKLPEGFTLPEGDLYFPCWGRVGMQWKSLEGRTQRSWAEALESSELHW